MPDERKPYLVELPITLVEQMQRLAEAHHRSRTGEMIVALERYVAQEKREKQ